MVSSSRSHAKVAYPEHRQRLIQLADDDQKEVQSHFLLLKGLTSHRDKEKASFNLAKRCHERAHEMEAILNTIGAPTIENVGDDGCKAVCLLTLHSYLSLMKKILFIILSEFRKNPANIYLEGIPPLKDRISILETRKQIFGTNWMMDADDKPFLIPVRDFKAANKNRAKYKLGPIKKPINLSKGAVKYPLGQGLAEESDQKDLNDEEYGEYSRHYLQSIL